MGGRAFLAIGRESVRLPTPDMARIAEAAARATGGAAVGWLLAKADHGDADVVVPESMRRADAETAAAVGSAAGLPHLHHRDSAENPILFVGLETPTGLFQVDLIHRPDETAGFCRRFLSWGDAGSMVGLVATEMGLKFGMDGLRVPVRAPACPKGSVLLTADFDEALDALGLDPAPHAAGFADDAETAAWIGSGRFHDPKLYDPSRASSDARRRGRARRGREDSLALLRSHPARHAWPEAKGDADVRRSFSQAAVDRFGMRDAVEAELARISALKRDQPTAAFSPDLIASIIGTDGRDVKATIVVMRDVLFPGDNAFPLWKANADEAEVRERTLAAHAILMERRAAEELARVRHAEQMERQERNRVARAMRDDGDRK